MKKIIALVKNIIHFIQIMVFVLAYLIVLFLGFIMLYFTFGNPKMNTMRFTGALFAILMAISSVAFSWAKIFDPIKERIQYNNVRFSAERIFLAALVFLFGTFIKYFMTNKNTYELLKNQTVVSILNYSFPIIFLIAFFIAAIPFSTILVMLFKRWIIQEDVTLNYKE